MREIGIPPLTSTQIDTLCELAEKSARKHILSRVNLRHISDLNITIEVHWKKQIMVDVDVDISLIPLMKDYDVKKLVKEASQKSFTAIEEYLKELKCNFKK